jgi:hypothetical protein
MNWRQSRIFFLDNFLIKGIVLAGASAISVFLMRLSCPRDLNQINAAGFGSWQVPSPAGVTIAAFQVARCQSNVEITTNTEIEFSPLKEVQCLLLAPVQEFS